MFSRYRLRDTPHSTHETAVTNCFVQKKEEKHADRNIWGSFLIAAAALKTSTRNGYSAQGVNLTDRFRVQRAAASNKVYMSQVFDPTSHADFGAATHPGVGGGTTHRRHATFDRC